MQGKVGPMLSGTGSGVKSAVAVTGSLSREETGNSPTFGQRGYRRCEDPGLPTQSTGEGACKGSGGPGLPHSSQISREGALSQGRAVAPALGVGNSDPSPKSSPPSSAWVFPETAT